MEPLIRYYERVDTQAAAMQAAVLEEVTYTKVMGTGAKQALSKVKTATKWAADWVGVRNSIDTSAPPTTSEIVLKRAEYWSEHALSVRNFVIDALASRLQTNAKDLGLLSTRLIEEAAVGYGLPDGLLLSQMAEDIAKKYIEDCIEGVREQLKKQGADEIRETEELLAKQIAAMTPAEKLEIQKALNLQNLSGSSVRSAFMTTGLPIASIAALQAGGFGTYLALTTVMHAVFTGMLGITLPFAAYTGATSALSFFTGPAGILLSLGLGVLGYFWGRRKIERSQYAMIVWTCVMHAEKPIAPLTSSLPSFGKHKLLTNCAQGAGSTPEPEHQDHLALQKERVDLSTANYAHTAAETLASTLNTRIRKAENRLRSVQNELASAQSRMAAEAHLKQALESQVTRQEATIAELKRELQRLRREADEATCRVDATKRATIEAEQRFVSRLERRSKEIQALWKIHYPKIDFNPQPLRWSAEQDFAGRLEIERALSELANAPDPVKLSRSRMHATGEHHSRFTIPGNVECRLFYTVKDGRIEIRRMCQKKDC